MISIATFPAYFSTNERKYVDVVMSKDVHIIGLAIENKLGITIRFLGEELYDTVIKQLNNC